MNETNWNFFQFENDKINIQNGLNLESYGRHSCYFDSKNFITYVGSIFQPQKNCLKGTKILKARY